MHIRFTFAALVAALTLVIAAIPATAAAAGQYDYLLAPEASCPGQSNSTSPAESQTASMRCLIDFARARHGVRATAQATYLDNSAQQKAQDILRCQQFSHTACGRTWDYWIRATGVSFSRWSENIAWGSNNGGYSTPRSIMRSWLYSDGHRTNLLNPSQNVKGVGLARGTFKGYAAGVWVQHFATTR